MQQLKDIECLHMPCLNLLKGIDLSNSLEPPRWFLLITGPQHWWGLSICLSVSVPWSSLLFLLLLHKFYLTSSSLMTPVDDIAWLCPFISQNPDIYTRGSRLCHLASIVSVQMLNCLFFSLSLKLRWTFFSSCVMIRLKPWAPFVWGTKTDQSVFTPSEALWQLWQHASFIFSASTRS